jgi:hypothetical protein
MVPYDRVRITVHSDWVLVCGIRADGSRGGSVPTLAEVITGFPGSLFHGGGVFASAEEALAHAMTLPLLDPARTSTLTRPTLVSPADPNLGRVH